MALRRPPLAAEPSPGLFRDRFNVSKLEVMQKKNSRKEEGLGESALTRPAERGPPSLPWPSNSQWGMQAPCKDLAELHL